MQRSDSYQSDAKVTFNFQTKRMDAKLHVEFTRLSPGKRKRRNLVTRISKHVKISIKRQEITALHRAGTIVEDALQIVEAPR